MWPSQLAHRGRGWKRERAGAALSNRDGGTRRRAEPSKMPPGRLAGRAGSESPVRPVVPEGVHIQEVRRSPRGRRRRRRRRWQLGRECCRRGGELGGGESGRRRREASSIRRDSIAEADGAGGEIRVMAACLWARPPAGLGNGCAAVAVQGRDVCSCCIFAACFCRIRFDVAAAKRAACYGGG